MGRRASLLAYLCAVCAVLPLVAAQLWTGFRLAPADGVLAVLSSGEQPLSVRSPAGEWAMLLALAWFALAYWRRDFRLWEITLVLIGGTAALVRAGNAWLDALLLILPLGRQLTLLHPPRWMLAAVAAVSLALTGATLYLTRPPALPQAAVAAAKGASNRGTVFADWRWAPQLQHELNSQRVMAANGLGSENAEFWLNYVRIVQDYEQWPMELQSMNVDLVVLNTENPALADQVRSSPEWRVLYDTANAFVAERASTTS